MTRKARAAFAAANTANVAISAAKYATTYLENEPEDWKLVDEAYWLCRAAQEACQRTVGALTREEVLAYELSDFALQSARRAGENVREAAEDLVSLAEKNRHEIRR